MKKGASLLLLLVAWVFAQRSLATVDDHFVEAHQNQLRQLFGALDPGHSGTAAARGLWAAGRHREAAEALSGYFGQRRMDPELLGPAPLAGETLQHAEAALARSFFLLGKWETVPETPEGRLDWEHTGSRGDKESAWMLNRHAFLPALLAAWQSTSDERFRTELNRLWADWIEANPYPARISFSAPWRPLEVARRILNAWTFCFFAEGALTPETRLLVLCSLLDHADALRHHASFWGGNHLISEKLALLILAVAWPEFKDSAEWAEYAAEKVSSQILEQTYPDGSYKELANHYQVIVLASARHLLRLLARIDPEFRQRPVYARVEAMWDFLAGVMRPDGYGPLNNDSDLEYNAGILRSAWEFHERPDWLAMASSGAEGVLPDGSANRFFPWAGQVILRTGWDAEASWLYFDAGPYGTAHQHEDRLHVSAAVDGRLLLADTGRYTYQPGPWRDFFRGAAGHSVVLLDGEAADQGPRVVHEPLPIAFTERKGLTFAAATAIFRNQHPAGLLPSMDAPVPWTRAVMMGPRGFICIIDHLVTHRPRQVEARWHFAPGVTEDEAAEILQLAGEPPGWSSHTVFGRENPEPGGFHSDDYNRRVAVPMRIFRGRMDRPTTLVWTLSSPEGPTRAVRILSEPGAPLLEMELLEAGAVLGTARVRLHPEPALIAFDLP